MDKALNTLPIQTYVRARASTIVVDVGGESSGTVLLDLAKASDVTLVIASLAYLGQPEVFVAAIDREPSLTDFDVITSPTDVQFVKNQDRVTLHLLPGQHQFRWKGYATIGTPQTFPSECSRLILAVDQ